MRILLLLFCLIAGNVQSIANHFTGAQLRYEYTGTPLIYRVELTLYKTCESSAIDLPTFINIYAQSQQLNTIINKNLPRITNDTLQPFCPGTTNTCTNLSAAYPGYITAIYRDTIKVTAGAPDWNFVFSNSSRNIGITNLQGASGQSFYVDAPANISGNNNTSARLPDNPPHVLFINDSLKIPLTATDNDGDSIAFSFAQPVSGTGVGVPYASGFSLSQPFGNGGLCYIDAKNNMILKSTQTGKYNITLKINEYRNGGFIGYSMRDFIIICVNAGAGSIVTVPEPITKKNLITFTCPGRSNTLQFKFIDPNPSDSVYLEIIPPTLSGWTFNVNTSNRIGDAEGAITWTTPQSLNPAILPYFNIEVRTRDNACQLAGKATYIYRVNTRDCNADSVWPGDANADKVVDLYDPLAIALAYGDTGSARANATTNWVGEQCNFWDGVFLNNIDKKHADCNGTGTVDTADLNAIALNYGKTHAKPGSGQKPTAGPELKFDHSGILAYPDSTVSIKILLGSSTAPVTGLYGLAANILVDGLALATPPAITYTTSWLGNSSNTLQFVKDVAPTSIDWAYARTNHQNINGQGLLANIEFKIPANTPPGTLVTLSYSKAKLIDNEGIDIIDFNTLQDTFYVLNQVSVSNVQAELQHISLYPNPSSNEVRLNLYAQQQQALTITVKDITGREMNRQEATARQGNNNIHLSVATLSAGVYIVVVQAIGGTYHTLKWVKQ